ncbi:MAG: DNA-binding protein [Microcystis wesenbergii Mw_MB_S_20031200_S109D]|uniref:DNA-binding protein n=1 Tax=Microcystis wesenbergii Mw_MB_S_20031200_S109D TaxID=2486241 RepID=A0A552M136_9CHRO|nr:MAG: DNA-binding protein [Microcystis wesenbergii Mw_MB_S_20031200_S109D]
MGSSGYLLGKSRHFWYIPDMITHTEITRLLTIPETAEMLRVSKRTIARLIADGQLHAPKIRRRRLISAASIAEITNQG